MKKYALLCIVAISLLSNSSFGQVYEKIYELADAQVQQRMNQNKMDGVAILSNIQAHHIIGVSGMSTTQKDQLEAVLAEDDRITSFTVSSDVTSVVLDSQAVFTKEAFAALIQPLNGIITGYNATYSVQD